MQFANLYSQSASISYKLFFYPKQNLGAWGWMRIFIFIFVFMVTGIASGDDLSGAAKAYSKAQEAEMSEDFGRAAQLYELANTMSPSVQALRSAAKARYAADEFAAAATLAEELKVRYPDDAPATAVADTILKQTAKNYERIVVSCLPECELSIGGKLASLRKANRHVIYLEVGVSSIVGNFEDGESSPNTIDAKAGHTTELTLQPLIDLKKIKTLEPSTTAEFHLVNPNLITTNDKKPSRGNSGISKWWLITGSVATVGLGGTLLWSGLDTLDNNDRYTVMPTQARLDSGRSKERRTNYLMGATALVGVLTIIAVPLTNWSSGGANREQRSLQVSIDDGAGNISFEGTF